jgi:hypothetical protein
LLDGVAARPVPDGIPRRRSARAEVPTAGPHRARAKDAEFIRAGGERPLMLCFGRVPHTLRSRASQREPLFRRWLLWVP